MARRDVLRFYHEVQDSYVEMVKDFTDLDKEHTEGLIDDDRYYALKESLESEMAPLKEEYERLSYIMFLLNIPQRAKKADKYILNNQVYFDYLQKYSRETVVDECSDGLAKIKELIRKAKEEKADESR